MTYGTLIPLGGGDPIPLPDPSRSGNYLLGAAKVVTLYSGLPTFRHTIVN